MGEISDHFTFLVTFYVLCFNPPPPKQHNPKHGSHVFHYVLPPLFLLGRHAFLPRGLSCDESIGVGIGVLLSVENVLRLAQK